MSLSDGDRAYVQHAAEPGRYHARLVLGHVEGAEWVVCTPSFDVYVEEISVESGDMTDVRIGSGSRLPVGLLEGNVFGFDPPLRAPQVRALLDEGRRLAALERARRGLGPVGPRGPADGGGGLGAAGGPVAAEQPIAGALEAPGAAAADEEDDPEGDEEIAAAHVGTTKDRLPRLGSGHKPAPMWHWIAAEDLPEAKVFFGDRLDVGGRRDSAKVLSRHGRRGSCSL